MRILDVITVNMMQNGFNSSRNSHKLSDTLQMHINRTADAVCQCVITVQSARWRRSTALLAALHCSAL